MEQVTISSVAQDKSKQWTYEAKRKHFREHANINLPPQYRSKYEELTLKHFKIVNIGKNDLGRVKDFFHKIHIIDNEPVCRKQFKIPDWQIG
jgi:hypothetical protein